MSTRAVIYPKSAQLTGEFGRDYAMRIFGLDETALEKLVGRYSRGPRKGMLRGVIVWHSVKSGGWVKTGRYDFDSMQGSGFVAKPGVRFGHSILDAKGKPVAGYPGDDIAGAYRWTIDARRSDTVMHSAAEAFDEAAARARLVELQAEMRAIENAEPFPYQKSLDICAELTALNNQLRAATNGAKDSGEAAE